MADPYMIPNKDPERWYYWASEKAADLRGTLDAGYRIEQGKTLAETKKLSEKLGLNPMIYVDDARNTIRHGMNILVSCSMSNRKALRKEEKEYRHAMREAATENFHETGDRIPGVRTFEMPMEEYDERKAIAEGKSAPRVFLTQTPPRD